MLGLKLSRAEVKGQAETPHSRWAAREKPAQPGACVSWGYSDFSWGAVPLRNSTVFQTVSVFEKTILHTSKIKTENKQKKTSISHCHGNNQT